MLASYASGTLVHGISGGADRELRAALTLQAEFSSKERCVLEDVLVGDLSEDVDNHGPAFIAPQIAIRDSSSSLRNHDSRCKHLSGGKEVGFSAGDRLSHLLITRSELVGMVGKTADHVLQHLGGRALSFPIGFLYDRIIVPNLFSPVASSLKGNGAQVYRGSLPAVANSDLDSLVGKRPFSVFERLGTANGCEFRNSNSSPLIQLRNRKGVIQRCLTLRDACLQCTAVLFKDLPQFTLVVRQSSIDGFSASLKQLFLWKRRLPQRRTRLPCLWRLQVDPPALQSPWHFAA